MKATPAAEPGWQRLWPARSRNDRLRSAIYFTCTTGLPMTAIAVHLALTNRPLESEGYTFLAAAAAAAIGEILWTIRAWIESRTMTEPKVMVTPAPMRRGEPFRLQVAMPRATRKRTELAVRIVCVEHAVLHYGRFTHLAINDHDDKVARLSRKETTISGESLFGEGKMSFAADVWPATTAGRIANRRYRWELRVEVAEMKEKTIIYPLNVI